MFTSNSLILAFYNSMIFADDLFHQVDAVQLPLPCSVRRPDQFPCLLNCVFRFNHFVLLSPFSCICHLSQMILTLPIGYAFLSFQPSYLPPVVLTPSGDDQRGHNHHQRQRAQRNCNCHPFHNHPPFVSNRLI